MFAFKTVNIEDVPCVKKKKLMNYSDVYLAFNLIEHKFVALLVRGEVSRRCKKIKPIALLKKTIPLTDWLFSYDWKNNVLGDIVAGITVAVMHIPQGTLNTLLRTIKLNEEFSSAK